MAADQGLLDSVANSNNKTVAESAAWSVAQVMDAQAGVATDQVAHRSRLNILAEKALSESLEGLSSMDPVEAASTNKMLTGSDLGQILSSLGASIAQLQQLMKGAQTTPPETAVPK